MTEDFSRLYREMCGEPQISYQRLQEILRAMRMAGECNDQLFEAIQENYAAHNWRCLGLLVGIIHWNPDPRFTPILCDLLDNHKAHVSAEDIADTLDYIQDARAVPSLIRSLDYYEPGDEDRNLNKKIIHALANIGNDEAIEGLRLAAQNPDEQIRITAERELARLKR